MKLDEKKLAKLAETCKTILFSADLDTITEKKVRRQAENELDLEDKILDEEPHKSYVKEIVKKVINDLQMKSESSRSPPQIGQAKTDSRISKTTIKPASTNKKSRKTEVKLEESSKAFEDECNVSSSKPLNGKARSKVSKQSSAESSPKTQASKAQNKIPKSSKAASPSLKPTNREEPSEKPEDIVDYKSPSSNSKPAKSNVMSKPSKQIEQVNKFKETEIKKEVFSEEESESAKEKRTTKSEANKEKRKSRSRVKRKINASSDSDDNKKSDLALALDEDEKPSKKATEDGQSRKIRAVEDGGSIMAPENELLTQKLDIVRSKNPIGLSGDDAESDNTIKGEDEERILERTIESDEDGHVSQNNSESMGKIEQEPNGSKAESTSPKRMIDSVEDDDDLSSLEDDEPRRKKRRTGKASAKPVNKKTVNRTVNSKTVNNKNSKTDNKTTVEKNDKRIKNLKSLISQCGVRKNWAKEFADCRTDSSKISKLKEILIDLGVEGRPTLEKCKKVRKRRELEAELGAMDVDNIISDDVKETRKTRASRGIFNTLRHRSSRVIQSSPEYDDASSDSSDSSEDKHSDFE